MANAPPQRPSAEARPSGERVLGGCELLFEAWRDAGAAVWVGKQLDRGGELVLVAQLLDPPAGAGAKAVPAARAIASLSHPKVLPTRKVSGEGELTVVSDFVDGESLRSLLRASRKAGERAPLGVALRIAADYLDALSALLEQATRQPELVRVIAGGVGPDGLVLSAGGEVRAVFQGVAARLVADPSWAKGPELLPYRGPEQLTPAAHADARTAVFGVGALVWELLAGRPPSWPGASSGAGKAGASPIARLDSPEIGASSAAVADWVARALERAPAARFQSPAVMRKMLRESLEGEIGGPEAVRGWVESVAQRALQGRRRALALLTGGGASAEGPTSRPPPTPRMPDDALGVIALATNVASTFSPSRGSSPSLLDADLVGDLDQALARGPSPARKPATSPPPRPGGATPVAATAVAAKPQAAKPEASSPEAARPVAARAEASRPVAARAEAARPVAARPEASRPVAARAEASRPIAARPEATPKPPIAGASGPATPEVPRAEAASPRPAAPEAAAAKGGASEAATFRPPSFDEESSHVRPVSRPPPEPAEHEPAPETVRGGHVIPGGTTPASPSAVAAGGRPSDRPTMTAPPPEALIAFSPEPPAAPSAEPPVAPSAKPPVAPSSAVTPKPAPAAPPQPPAPVAAVPSGPAAVSVARTPGPALTPGLIESAEAPESEPRAPLLGVPREALPSGPAEGLGGGGLEPGDRASGGELAPRGKRRWVAPVVVLGLAALLVLAALAKRGAGPVAEAPRQAEPAKASPSARAPSGDATARAEAQGEAPSAPGAAAPSGGDPVAVGGGVFPRGKGVEAAAASAAPSASASAPIRKWKKYIPDKI